MAAAAATVIATKGCVSEGRAAKSVLEPSWRRDRNRDGGRVAAAGVYRCPAC